MLESNNMDTTEIKLAVFIFLSLLPGCKTSVFQSHRARLALFVGEVFAEQTLKLQISGGHQPARR